MKRRTEAERIEEYERVADAPRLFCWRRPLEIWDRDPDTQLATCVETRPYLDVLIDRISGTRSVLQKLTDPRAIDRWHDVAARSATKALLHPVTCTRDQLLPLLDTKSKVIFVFGGNQSGKSTIGGSWLTTRIAEHGGLFMWLAPTQEKTQVGVEKLCINTEFAQSAIPQELIAYYPKSEKVTDQCIRLVDGTVIRLRYCSRKGANLKGVTGVRGAVMDEAADVAEEINFTIALNRLSRAAGQLLVPTTPVVPSWLQDKDRETKTYGEVEAIETNGEKRPANVKVYFSMLRNPWMPPGEVERTIESLGGEDDPRVQREVFGRWVAEGKMLWRHFAPKLPHVVEWGRRDPAVYGFTDITPLVASELFRQQSSSTKVELLGGIDFNFDPYSCAICKVLVPNGSDQRDPENWVIYVDDCVVKTARSTAEFATWLTTQAGAWRGRGLPPTAFAGLHAVCDATGFYRGRDRRANASADADELRKAGMVVRPPRYNEGKELNPPRRVRIGFMNELFFRNKIILNRQRCAELIDALQTETDDGSGNTLKGKHDRRDKISGITDGLGYLVYAVLFHRKKKPDASESKGKW